MAAGGGSDSSRIGAVDPRLAELATLLDQGDREPGGSAGERRLRRPDRPVPVAEGLDDRAELGRGDQVGQQPGVVPDGVQVDLGPRRPERAPDAGTTPPRGPVAPRSM